MPAFWPRPPGRPLARRAEALTLSLALAVSGAACTPAKRAVQLPIPDATATPAAPTERTVPLFFVTRMLNTPEPCGCSSEPLGDVARLVARLKAEGGLLLDAGGLRYDDPPMDQEKLRQAKKKADFLERLWAAQGAITMLQPEDLRAGLEDLRGTHRLISNATGLPEGVTVREILREVGGVKLGVLGLADPEEGWPQGVQISDPIAAATEGVARLREQGAQLIVALTGMKRDKARRLLRKVPGLVAAVAGHDRELAEGLEDAEQVNGALLVVPADKGQKVARLVLHLPAVPATKLELVPHRSEAQQLRQAEATAAQLALIEKRLAGLRADTNAEPAFLRTTETEVERLRAELTKARTPSPPPPISAERGYVTAELVPIRRALPRDPEVAKQMTALDRQIGEDNLAALSGPPPAVKPTEARYVGTAGCVGGCHFHDDAIEFWRDTRHGHAWKTLVDGGKDLSYDCINCHSTGFDLPGGSNLWTLARWQRATAAAALAPAPAGSAPAPATDPKKPAGVPAPAGPAAPAGLEQQAGPDLRDVQCEVCHGPGSLHVRSPNKNPIQVPRPTEARCLECHTKEHSDTFQFQAYLRDILGPGHGAERRKELGDGPTGHALRSAALKKSAAAH